MRFLGARVARRSARAEPMEPAAPVMRIACCWICWLEFGGSAVRRGLPRNGYQSMGVSDDGGGKPERGGGTGSV